jgi:hypothetical protein
MKAEDVMKALECCMLTNEQQECRCEECPLWETSVMVCQELLAYHALALLREKDALIAKHEAYIDTLNDDKANLVEQIEKKDAEIERLTVNMNAYGLTAKNLAQEFEDYRADVQMEIADARAEAITEFAEKIKTFYHNLSGKTVGGSVEYHIDQIAKEMKGGDGNEQS